MSDAAGWSRIEAALDELLALPPEQRVEALARLAGDDAAMRAELENLLAETRAPDGLLDRPAVAAYQPEAQPQGSLTSGERIGAWRIAGLIGRGGMGEVYRAERADGQFEQQVALKLIRRDATGEPRRFTAERQILARLEHPGIARLLDGGVAGDGRPYMVMELVQGGAITEWCRTHEASLEQRLKLFMAVCEAVAYAHRNLVIHRDLKPGNVMVTAAGEVKLLDFGIAKLLRPDGAVDAEQTRHIPLTLGYAAPEQLAGGAVTTAADVYALGMLLYELLSGRRPWSLSELSMPAALDKLLREPPPPPSRSAAQGGAPPVPPRLLHGDLDAIVAKALRKEPERRYATVEALREDVARHLAGEVVTAREGARLYAFGRFVGRNRLMVGATALLLLAILGGSLGIAWQARRAEIEAHKATAVKNFLVNIFNDNGRDNPDGAKARATTAEQLLDLGAKRIHNEMQDAPDVRAELLGTIGGLYSDLDLSDRALGLLQEQVDTLHKLYSNAPNAQIAEAEVRLGEAQSVAGRYQEAEYSLTTALQTLDDLHDRSSLIRATAYEWLAQSALQSRPVADPAAERYANNALHIIETSHPQDSLRIAVLAELGRIAFWRKNFSAAEGFFKEALALLQMPQFNQKKTDLAGVHIEYGELLQRVQRYDEAEVELRMSIALYLTQVGPDYPQTLRAQEDLGGLLYERGRLAEARPIMASALRSFENVRGVDDLAWTTDARIYFARLLLARGEIEAAGKLFEQSIASLRDHAPTSVYLAIALRWQTEFLTAQGQWKNAELAVAEARAGLAKFYGESHERYAGALLAEAALRLAQLDARRAEALYQQVLDLWPPPADQIPDIYTYSSLGLSRVRLLQGRPAEAAQLAKQVLDRLLASPQADSFRAQEAAAQLWLGTALLQQGDAAMALPHLQRAVALREAMDDSASPWLAQARIALAECRLDRGELNEGRQLLMLAAAAQNQHPDLGAQLRQPLQKAQAHLRQVAGRRPAPADQ